MKLIPLCGVAVLLLLAARVAFASYVPAQQALPLSQPDPIQITYGTDVTITEMNFHETLLEADSNHPTLPPPSILYEATASGNRAHAAATAATSESGIAKARVGILYELQPGTQSWDAISELPVEVTVMFSYTVRADWTLREGSGNAGVSIRPFTSPWYDFLGFETQETGSRTQSVEKVYSTTFSRLGDRIVFEANSQAHVAANGTQNSSQADVQVASITFRFCRDTDNNGNPDNDGDALCDHWETEGIDYDGDGTIDLNLHRPPFNADPNHKDIFVEIDYMTDTVHSHRPRHEALTQMTRAFNNAATVSNPDGRTGIRLHLMVDEGILEVDPVAFITRTETITNDFGDLKWGNPRNPCGTGPNDGHFGTPAERRNPNCANILGARRLAFHYAVFAHSFVVCRTCSGIADLPGNDLLVTLGNWSRVSSGAALGTRIRYEAGTLMHEFGHNLKLQHGGSDSINYKPNYLSVMNYTFQLGSVVPSRPLNYSQWALAPLWEGGLAENKGIDDNAAPANLAASWPQTAFTYYNTISNAGMISDTCRFQLTPTVGDIDWDHDGAVEGGEVAAGINEPDGTPNAGELEWCQVDGLREVLTSHDDWSNVLYNFRTTPSFADGANPQVPSDLEMTAQLDATLAELSDSDNDGVSNDADNCLTIANADQADDNGDGIGNACTLEPLLLSSPRITGGMSVTGTIQLLVESAVDGATLELYSDTPAAASLPISVTIPAGSSTAQFVIGAQPVSQTTTANISVIYGDAGHTAELTIEAETPDEEGQSVYLPLVP